MAFYPVTRAVIAISLVCAASLPAQVGGAGIEVRDHEGESPGDSFGTYVALVGDIDRDGVDDFASGASLSDFGFLSSGSVSVYSGRTGTLLTRTHGQQDLDQLGWILSAAGDVNADGTPDVLAWSLGQQFTWGAVNVLSGVDGSRIHYLEADDREFYGRALAPAGDLNQDGYDDFAVGAYLDGKPTWRPGSVTVYSGKDASILLKVHGRRSGDWFGISIEGNLDLNQDGIPDLLVGSSRAEVQGIVDVGAVVAVNGATGGRMWTSTGALDQRFFGQSIAAIGDLTGDGVSELLVSNPNSEAGGAPQSGQAFVLDGRTGALLWQMSGTFEDERLGRDVAPAGDVNRDGVPDLLISAAREFYRDDLYGMVHLHSGVDGARLHSFRGSVIQGYFGETIDGGVDFDLDGIPDFLVGEPQFAASGLAPGAVRIRSFDSFLGTDQTTLSLSQGATAQLQLDFPDQLAGLDYALLLSSSGVEPSFYGGLWIPLRQDAVFAAALAGNLAPYLIHGRGTLDAEGRATAALQLPANAPGSARGRQLFLAAVVGSRQGLIETSAPLSFVLSD